MLATVLISIFLQVNISSPSNQENYYKNISTIQLTEIGQFGLKRKARENVPEHYHTGIDIKRSGNNYNYEPIFPIAEGKVISKRTDGPYANLIIEHTINGKKVWSLYEHIADIKVNIGDWVKPSTHIARFMNKEELNKHGWQFDHFHLEIMKIKPLPIRPTSKNPDRFYNAYSLVCYTMDDLNRYYYNPILFLKEKNGN